MAEKLLLPEHSHLKEYRETLAKCKESIKGQEGSQDSDVGAHGGKRTERHTHSAGPGRKPASQTVYYCLRPICSESRRAGGLLSKRCAFQAREGKSLCSIRSADGVRLRSCADGRRQAKLLRRPSSLSDLTALLSAFGSTCP